jgi:hypothetical protein
MKISPCLFLIFFGALIFSCTKDNLTDLSYPSAYHKSGSTPNGNLRVFTSTGEITDKDIISRFNESDTSRFNGQAFNIGNYPGNWDSVNRYIV